MKWKRIRADHTLGQSCTRQQVMLTRRTVSCMCVYRGIQSVYETETETEGEERGTCCGAKTEKQSYFPSHCRGSHSSEMKGDGNQGEE